MLNSLKMRIFQASILIALVAAALRFQPNAVDAAESVTLQLRWNKAQIIQKGIELGVDYAMTHSCCDPTPDGQACGACDSCQLRRKGFREAGVEDPTIYAPGA